MDAGLFFLAYQRDPRTQFVADPDASSSRIDALNEYIKHDSSRAVRVPAGRQRRRLLGRHALRLTRESGVSSGGTPDRDFVRVFTSA